MSLINRFNKKDASDSNADQWPQTPKADTMCFVFMDRILDDIEPAIELLKDNFGERAVGEIDRNHPSVHTFIIMLDNLEFWCSYLPMPVPADTLDMATVAQYNILISHEEKEDFINHKSFWMLAQKGGGASPEEKREVCWSFSRLCAALLGLQDFGLPELGFYNPKKFSAKELLDYLYSMSCLQITGRQLYRNATLIPMDAETEVVCKQDGDVLFFIGA